MKEVLKNKNIVVTRSEEQSSRLIELLKSAGSNIISIPAINIIPVQDYSSFDDFVLNSPVIDYIIFTSSNAVKYFFNRLGELNLQLNFSKIKVAAVGESTKKTCLENNIQVEITPEQYNAAGLLKKFETIDIKNKYMLIPCSSIARTELSLGLKRSGAIVESFPVYDVALPDPDEIKLYREKMAGIEPDLFIFTSPSTYKNFLKMFNIMDAEDFFRNSAVAVIGSTTAGAIKESGVGIDIIPNKFTADGLFDKIIEHYSNNNR